MDSGIPKAIVMVLLKNLKNLETELIAYRMLFQSLRQTKMILDLDEALQAAKHTAEKGMDEKYDKALETFWHIVDQGNLDQAVAEFLKSWNSKGPVN